MDHTISVVRFVTDIYGRPDTKPNFSREYGRPVKPVCLCRNGLQRVLRGKGGKRRTLRRRQDKTPRDRQHRMGCIRRRRKIGRRPHEIRSGNRRGLVEPGTTKVCGPRRMTTVFPTSSVLGIQVSEMCAFPCFRFEKMISGMYMGEIVRLAIVDLANQNKLFEGRLSEQMKTKGAFGTSFVSDIERWVLNYVIF